MIELDMNIDIRPAENMDKAMEENYKSFFRDFLDMVLQFAKRNLSKGDPYTQVNTGFLLNSGRVEIKWEQKEGSVIFSAPYAPFVEFGTRPHTPPLGPSLPHKKSGKKIEILSVPDPEANPLDYWAWRVGSREGIYHKKYGAHTALGFAVWNKIRRYGSDPHPFLRPAIADGMRFISRLAKKYGLGGY